MAGPYKNLAAFVDAIDRGETRAEGGLPELIFKQALKIMPMANVDLFVKNREGHTLLAWRIDEFGKGWHIPGGIIRYRESITDRIAQCANLELGVAVDAESVPCQITEFPDLPRGHFISLLYRCKLLGELDVGRLYKSDGKALEDGQLFWFDKAPEMYPSHEQYIEWINGGKS